MQIEELDAHDDAALAAWHAAFSCATSFGRVDPPLWTLPELTTMLRCPDSTYGRAYYSAVDSGEIVGVLSLELPLLDNTDHVEVEVDVLPEHHRHGVGDALMEIGERRCAQLGRTTLDAFVNQPVDAPAVPGIGFAAKHRFILGNVEMCRRLPLPVPTDRLDALAEHAAERASGYRLQTWVGACPEEYVDQYAELKGRLSTDAPLGAIAYEKEDWTAERVREDERKSGERGRTVLTTIAVAGDDAVVGHTQLAVPAHDATRAFQWDTLVLRAHRGHRLGLALKAANHRAATPLLGERRLMDTWNAEQNGPMIAVNEALGYRPVERSLEYQRLGNGARRR